MSTPQRLALVASLVRDGFIALIALANLFARRSGGDGDSAWMMASGITLGFVAVPVFSILLPIWRARRRGLAASW